MPNNSQLTSEIVVRRQIIQLNGQRILRRRKPYKMRFPRGIQLEYTSVMRNYQDKISQVVREILFPLLGNLVPQETIDSRRYDANDSIDESIETLRAKIGNIEIESDVQQIIEKTSAWQRAELREHIKYKLGFDLLFSEPWLIKYVEQARKENIRLISKMTNEELSNVEGILRSGFKTGRRVELLREQIVHQLGVSKSRSYLIARDQVNKMNGELNMQRQTSLGVSDYTWMTSQDGKVRPSHVDRHGRVYSWEEPPEDGDHPGFEIQCRCTAEPNLDHLLQ